MKSIYYILALCALPFLAEAQQALSLEEAIAIGLKENYQVQIARSNQEIAQNNNTWKAAGRHPSVNATVGNQNAYAKVNNPASFISELDSYGSDWSANVEATYTIFDGFRVQITKERLDALQRQSDISIQSAMENTVQSILLAYHQALIQKEQLGTLEEVIRLSKDRIQLQEVRKEFGQAGKFDLLQSNDAYLNDSTAYLIQLNSYENSLQNLKLAMGIEDRSIKYELSEGLNANTPNYDLATLEQDLISNNPDVKALTLNNNLAAIDTRLQRSALYPRISAAAGVNQNLSFSYVDAINPATQENIGSANGNTFRAYLSFNLSYNLYNGGNTRRNIENSKLQEQVAALNMLDLKRRLKGQLQTILNTYNNQKRLIQLTEQLVANAQENLNIANERFRAGQINSFDYRSIQLAFINASQSRLLAIFNLKNTEVEIKRLTGGLVR